MTKKVMAETLPLEGATELDVSEIIPGSHGKLYVRFMDIYTAVGGAFISLVHPGEMVHFPLWNRPDDYAPFGGVVTKTYAELAEFAAPHMKDRPKPDARF